MSETVFNLHGINSRDSDAAAVDATETTCQNLEHDFAEFSN